MAVSLRRDFKAPTERLDDVRAALAASGAVRDRVVEQIDYVYDVPAPIGGPHLAKLRHERPDSWMLYAYDPAEHGPEVSFQLLKGLDQSVKDALDLLLGRPVKIEKTREIWREGGLVIHVDDVRGRGGIVEIESWAENDRSSLEYYRRLLGPLCGSPTRESNVDFARRTSARRESC